MATKPQTAETENREEPTVGAMLDITQQAVKKMIAKGKERGFITYDELNAALPQEKISSEQIEDTMAILNEMGINVVENEEAEEPAVETETETDGRAAGNIDEEDIGRTDDPVRMYLRPRQQRKLPPQPQKLSAVRMLPQTAMMRKLAARTVRPAAEMISMKAGCRYRRWKKP